MFDRLDPFTLVLAIILVHIRFCSDFLRFIPGFVCAKCLWKGSKPGAVTLVISECAVGEGKSKPCKTDLFMFLADGFVPSHILYLYNIPLYCCLTNIGCGSRKGTQKKTIEKRKN